MTIIKFSMLDYFGKAHAMVANFGLNGRSVSKIEYYVNLIS